MKVKALVPTQKAFVAEHYLASKDHYYFTFVRPIQTALEAAGHSVMLTDEPQNHTHNTWLLRLELPDTKPILAAIDYSDPTTLPNIQKGSCDLVVKMKYALRSTAEYGLVERLGIPVIPGGYVLAPDGNMANINAEYLLANLDRLRRIQSTEPPREKLLTAYAYRARERCKERQDLYLEAWSRQPKRPFQEYAVKIAQSRFVLNACGPHKTIDRKVVEFCAIGAAILSGRGLDDLILPYGHRFQHGKNVWFVDTVNDMKKAMMMDENQRQTLIDGSKELFDCVFSPKVLGSWLVDTIIQTHKKKEVEPCTQ